MARRRKGKPIHGWLIIDKPAGATSARIVAKVRAITGAAKLGHGGTLDPLATGVLPIALGEATKTVAYVMDGAKRYRFVVRWGEERDTDDIDGSVTATSPDRPDDAAIRAALAAFRGEILQAPPAYSAVKIAGRRAYDLARARADVRPEARRVRIDSFDLVGQLDADHAEFEVSCGKGAYMRALARDLGRALGTGACIARLRRTAVGPFAEKDAISLAELESLGHIAALAHRLIPVEAALDDIPALAVTEIQAGYLRQGRPVRLPGAAGHGAYAGPPAEPEAVLATFAGKPVALARRTGGEIRPVRVLNL
jgi:tRNA pseudouridine55 synthase